MSLYSTISHNHITLRKELRRRGIRIRPNYECYLNKIPQEIRDAIIAEIEAGAGRKAAAEKHGFSQNVADGELRRRNIKPRNNSESKLIKYSQKQMGGPDL